MARKSTQPEQPESPELRCKAARSYGYAAGYEGQHDRCPIPGNGPEAKAWKAGYEAARKALS